MIITINEKDYDCVEGSVITQTFNETLDSALIKLAHVKEPIDIEPFDLVEIEDYGYMCVNDYTQIEEGLDPIFYTYEINLFSVTKRLENIILPNIAITPHGNSVAFYIRQYIREYAEGIVEIDPDGHDLDVFENMACPEMQWNTPTLREVLNDLMMVGDFICTVRDGIYISGLDLTKRGSQIDKTTCNYIRRSRSSQDYVSEIRMNLQNAMEDYSTIRTEVIPYTALSGHILTSETFSIKTQMPIRRINHFWMNFVALKDGVSDYVRVRVDLINDLAGPLVLEKNAYDLLDILYFTAWSGIPIDQYMYKYQNFCLYYNRYSNVISGLTDKLSSKYTADETKMQVLYDYFGRKYLGAAIDITNNVFFTSLFFEIEYETTADLVFSASRSKEFKNKRVIMDNQNNSFVNTKLQADLEYQKVNRLGNEQLMINQRVYNLNDAIKISQMYNNAVVYQTQYQVYTDHIEVNALATDNYVLQNYFTGIKSHIRTWVNAKDEAITRHELVKERYLFSYTYDTNPDYTIFLTVALEGGQGYKRKYCEFRPLASRNPITFITNESFIVDCISRVLSTSMVFTFGCEDNAIVYTYYNASLINPSADITTIPVPKLKETFTGDYSNDSYGGMPLKSFKYVDDNFENEGIIFQLHIDSLVSEGELIDSGSSFEIYAISDSGTYMQDYMKSLYNSPVHYGPITTGIQVIHHKDNKEISKYSYQIEFGVDDINNIYISKYFAERQEMITDEVVGTLSVYKSDKFLQKLPDEAELVSSASIDTLLNAMAISFNEGDIDVGDYIYLVDSNSHVVLAYKYIEEYSNIVEGVVYTRLYLNKKE